MSDLRSLMYTLNYSAGTNYPTELLVYNTSYNSGANGGQCCNFVVPAGASFVTFEMWGGGGGGSGACCCMQSWPGGGASYSVKTVYSSALAGCSYTVCAAGTTYQSVNCIGCGGNTSYVTGYGLSNFCANGGSYGNATCWLYFSCYTCSTEMPYCCCAYGGDVNIHGIQSGYTGSTWCAQYGQQHAQTAPAAQSGPFYGPGGCINGSQQGNLGCSGWFGYTPFPGGGGLSAQAYGGSCWCGGMGGGGLVSITYG